MPDPVLIRGYAKYHTETELEDFHKKALTHLQTRASKPIHVNTLSEDGQSSGGINLASADEIREFIANIEAALEIVTGETTSKPEERGVMQNRGNVYLDL